MQPDGPTRFAADLIDGGIVLEYPATYADVPQDKLAKFSVLFEDLVVTVDLMMGSFVIGDQALEVQPPNAALRLVYYKTMRHECSSDGVPMGAPILDCFVVGWQATVTESGQYKNVRLGVRVFPAEYRWEVTEEI